MYTEFMVIFVCLGLIIVLLAVILILLIIVMKRTSGNMPMNAFSSPINIPTAVHSQQPAQVSGQSMQGGGVVFCKNCYTQFDSSVQFCPKCGTPRP